MGWFHRIKLENPQQNKIILEVSCFSPPKCFSILGEKQKELYPLSQNVFYFGRG
jgi:hypothetical protein